MPDFDLTTDAAGGTAALRSGELELQLEQHRRELTAYAYRMLASAFDAEDAVQETFIRAWRGYKRFEGRAALRSWLYRIATNVCLDMLNGRERRARPMDLGPAQAPIEANLNTLPEATWIQPVPDGLVVPEGDPAEVAVGRETIRLAFIAALQHLPPRQRAVLILCEVLRWQATEVAELLDTSVASVNSALQRARATLAAGNVSASDPSPELTADDQALLARYVEAFERYDMEALTSLIQEDATQSMPPFDLWLRGRDDILAWWVGPGGGCRGSKMVPTVSANGSPAYGQYKPSATGDGYDPWALQVIEMAEGRIVEFTFFLDTETLFPLFGLPAAARGVGLVRQDVAQAHECDAVRAARPTHCAAGPGNRAAARRAGAVRVRPPSPHPGVDAAHVAHGDAGVVSLQQRADARAEPGQVGARDRTRDGERRSTADAEAATRVPTAPAAETHRCRTDEFRITPRSY